MPPELVEKLRASARFNAGYQNLRQIYLGRLDFSYHDGDPGGMEDVAAHEWTATKGTYLFDRVPGTSVSHAFLHIFAGGYSAGCLSFFLNSPTRLSQSSILAPCRFMMMPCWMIESVLFQAQ